MKLISLLHEMRECSRQMRSAGDRIALAPTMGFLHEGHLSLVQIARKYSDKIVLSLFVNPTQFGDGEDYKDYSRDFDRDADLAEKAGVDVLFHPEAKDMYAGDVSVFVDEKYLSLPLCGLSRPGHFRGVLTVVAKLFNIVLPDIAVFGEKDGQQLRLIRRMVRDLNFPIKILSGPIIRESDGLAMSSRNVYLSDLERKQALCLKEGLDLALHLFEKGERDAEKIREAVIGLIESHSNVKVVYVELVDDKTLQSLKSIDSSCLVAIAVNIGKSRLIDNVLLQ